MYHPLDMANLTKKVGLILLLEMQMNSTHILYFENINIILMWTYKHIWNQSDIKVIHQSFALKCQSHFLVLNTYICVFYYTKA
jgi:hypothetical protein